MSSAEVFGVAATPRIRGELRYNEPMAAHNSWRAGGSADRFFMPADLEDLGVFLAALPPDEPLVWVGLGSNLLVRDGGIRGTVICTRNRLKEMTLAVPDTIRVQAGVPCAHVARFGAEHGLVGAEFLAGIIEDREPDLTAYLAGRGLQVVRRLSQGDWVSLTVA